QIEMPRNQLRLEQLAEIARRADAARQHGFAVTRRAVHLPVPGLHELGEILVDDFGAVEALVAGRDRSLDGVHLDGVAAVRSARRESHCARVWPQISMGSSSCGAGNLPGPCKVEPRRRATDRDAVFSESMQWMIRVQANTSNAQSIAATAASTA